MTDGFRIGVDLGGTKIECVVMDATGSVCWHRRIRTPRGNYDGTIAALARLVAAARGAAGSRATVGIGIPGAVSARTGLFRHGNATWLIGRPLQHDIETALGVQVRIENDANCLAVSEAADGAGNGAVLAVVLGTGVGAAHTLDAWSSRLARSLATVINLLDPDVIVVGGGPSNISQLFRDVPKYRHRHVFSDEIRTRLAAAAHGDASGVRGAAWLWPRHPDGSG